MRTLYLDDSTRIDAHDQGEALSDHIARTGRFFEEHILDYIRDNYRQHTFILDVGANIGNHTLYFARNLDYQAILALEPIPDNYALLEQNVKGLERVYTRRVAAGDSDGTVRFYIDRGNMGACSITEDGEYKTQQIRLDDLFIPKVTLLKIDVEWYEPQVLAGAKNLIEEDRPLILIEDAKEEYSTLLPPYYRLIAGWREDKTYLYGVE